MRKRPEKTGVPARGIRARMIAMALFTALAAACYPGFLFLPYFRFTGIVTNASDMVTGIEASVGFSEPGAFAITPRNDVLLAFNVIGMVGALLALIFTLWLIFSPRKSPYIFLILALAVPCLAVALAGILLSGPLHRKAAALNSFTIDYTWQFYVTLGLAVLALVLALTTLIYGALHLGRRKALAAGGKEV